MIVCALLMLLLFAAILVLLLDLGDSAGGSGPGALIRLDQRLGQGLGRVWGRRRQGLLFRLLWMGTVVTAAGFGASSGFGQTFVGHRSAGQRVSSVAMLVVSFLPFGSVCKASSPVLRLG